MKRLVLSRLDIDPEGGPTIVLAPHRDAVCFRKVVGRKAHRDEIIRVGHCGCPNWIGVPELVECGS
jgi:predicted nucleic acid-binding Zn finger protein